VNKKKNNLKRHFVNFFGALGYLVCLMQWLWVVLLYSSVVKSVALFFGSEANNTVSKSPVVFDYSSNLASVIVVVIITLFMTALSIYIIFKMPSIIVKTSKNAVRKTAESVTPLVLRAEHKKDNKKNHIKLSARITMIIKIILLVIPIILAYTSQYIEKQDIDLFLAMYIMIWLLFIAAVFFGLQYLFAMILKIKKQEIW